MKTVAFENVNTADLTSPTILGQFDGECLVLDKINNNGWEMDNELWEKLLDSEEYEKAIKHGWYIGYLGHPEDPNCMDFEHACIVLRNLELKNNGKLYGKFDLIDTPVGRIVKAFIDAGVKFGISIRGVGDIVGQRIDPDTFIFRGFDLVTFPAYPDSIPSYTAIAASTDTATVQKCKAIKASIETNLDQITSKSTLDEMKLQFSENSDEYKAIESKESELDAEPIADIKDEKLTAMTKLYVEASATISELNDQVSALRREVTAAKKSYDKKISTIKRITAAQISDIHSKCTNAAKEYKERVSATADLNLKYKQEVTASRQVIAQKDITISRLNVKLDETVAQNKANQQRKSNLDSKVSQLGQELEATQTLLQEYQDAYAKLYAAAIGARASQISISANTSVDQLKAVIAATNTVNVPARISYIQPIEDVEILEDDDIITI